MDTHTDISAVKDEELSASSMTSSPALPSLRTLDRLSALLLALRPRQWTKNLAVFVGIVFAQRLLNPLLFERAVIA
ncbi:MAG: hypothetical protein ACRDHW_21490, partial [Ktedonobacteraceae bacterium]